jgi:hypothetical protein
MDEKNSNNNRIARKDAQLIGDVLPQCIKMMGLSSGMNTHVIFKAWDDVSGAKQFTLNRFFRSGVLYITVNSSVIRSQLYFQIDVLKDKINEYLSKEEIFDKNNSVVGYVKKIVLK